MDIVWSLWVLCLMLGCLCVVINQKNVIKDRRTNVLQIIMKNSVLIAGILILIGCKHNNTEEDFQRKAQIDPGIPENISFDNDFELEEKIKLETTNKSLLGDIKHIKPGFVIRKSITSINHFKTDT